MKDDPEAAVEMPEKAADPPASKPDTSAEKAAPSKSSNKWTDLGDEIAKLGATTKLGELEPKEAPPDKPDKKAAAAKPAGKPAAKADATTEAEAPEPGTEEEPEAPEGKKPATKGEAEPEPTTRYSVIADDGTEFEFEPLPKGAKIEFKAGGKKLTVTSLDDLVGLAQQVPGLRQMEASYQGKLKTVSARLTAAEERLAAADRAFREIVESDEKLEEYRARVAKLKDPEYREGLEARRKLAAKEAEDQEAGEATLAEVTEEFWAEARNQFDTKLATYPTLDAEDYPDVVQTFWGNFTAHRETLLEEAAREVGTRELTKAELEQIDTDAIAWLTEENFEAAMRTWHEKIERRSGRTGGGNGRRKAATQEEADAADADRHNKHVDDKLRQRDTRTLKGKGTPPGVAAQTPKRPTSWADHMASIHEEFDKAKKPAVTE